MAKKLIKIKSQKYYKRLDHFLTEQLPDYSRARIEKLILAGSITLNSAKVLRKNITVNPLDTVCVELQERIVEDYQPSQTLAKIFEDSFILIIDKPAGISVHPGSGEKSETILDIFQFYYPQINSIPGTDRPGIVHRLDKDTSGLLILAKDQQSMVRLQKSFKKRLVRKTYLAIVSGKMRFRHGSIDFPIVRSQKNRRKFIVDDTMEIAGAREALTEYSVWLGREDISLLKVQPITGRTHQIRVHMAHLGHPILGDPLYGNRLTFSRLALHAYSLVFKHPINGNQIIATSPMPDSFRNKIMDNR